MRAFWTFLSLIWNVLQTALVLFPKIASWFLTILGLGGAGDDLKAWERWLMDESVVRVIALVLLCIGVVTTILIFRRGRTQPSPVQLTAAYAPAASTAGVAPVSSQNFVASGGSFIAGGPITGSTININSAADAATPLSQSPSPPSFVVETPRHYPARDTNGPMVTYIQVPILSTVDTTFSLSAYLEKVSRVDESGSAQTIFADTIGLVWSFQAKVPSALFDPHQRRYLNIAYFKHNYLPLRPVPETTQVPNLLFEELRAPGVYRFHVSLSRSQGRPERIVIEMDTRGRDHATVPVTLVEG